MPVETVFCSNCGHNFNAPSPFAEAVAPVAVAAPVAEAFAPVVEAVAPAFENVTPVTPVAPAAQAAVQTQSVIETVSTAGVTPIEKASSSMLAMDEAVSFADPAVAPANKVFCQSCGCEVSPSARFCPGCAAPMNAAPTATSAIPQPTPVQTQQYAQPQYAQAQQYAQTPAYQESQITATSEQVQPGKKPGKVIVPIILIILIIAVIVFDVLVFSGALGNKGDNGTDEYNGAPKSSYQVNTEDQL